MKELRDRNAIKALLRDISERVRTIGTSVRIMEVCGTHTMSLFKHGLTPLLSDIGVEMISGPGCPVCITPNSIHEAAIHFLTSREGLTLATFGDMTRVPTQQGSLQTAIPARDSRLKIVYSPQEALQEAKYHPTRDVVFLGVGFETTIPAIALTVKAALEEGVKNFAVLPAFWLVPPALRAVVESGETTVSGFIYPGHVSAIIGIAPYAFIAKDHGLPGAVAGFEPGDILLAVRSILDQIHEDRPRVALEYSRVVRPEGNPVALAVMNEVTEPFDALWRGLGRIPQSGLRFRNTYDQCDAERKYGYRVSEEDRDLPHCRCGEVLRGIISPEKCGLYGKKCSPESPLGPCMVSFEGACLIHFKYGR